MGKFFLYAILLWIAYFLVKNVAKGFFTSSEPQDNTPSAPPVDAEMVRDPECGTYFMPQKGVKGVVAGKVLHFCSEECYDKYLRHHK
jgi:YHS domain-containing protein